RWMPGRECLQEFCDDCRADRAQRAEPQRRVLQLEKLPRRELDPLRARRDFFQLRAHQESKVGKTRLLGLPAKEHPAELLLEFSNSAAQRRLRHVAFGSSASEVERLA